MTTTPSRLSKFIFIFFCAIAITSNANAETCGDHWSKSDLAHDEIIATLPTGETISEKRYWNSNKKVRIFIGDAGHPLALQMRRSIIFIAEQLEMPIEHSFEPRASDIMFSIYEAWKEPSDDFLRALDAYFGDEAEKTVFLEELLSHQSILKRKRKTQLKNDQLADYVNDPDSIPLPKALSVIRLPSLPSAGQSYNTDLARAAVMLVLFEIKELKAMLSCPEYAGVVRARKNDNGFQEEDLLFLRMLHGATKKGREQQR